MVREHGPCLLNHLITPKLCSQLFCSLDHLRINGIGLRSVPHYLCEVRTLLGIHLNHLDLMLCSKCTQVVGIGSCRFIDEPYCLVPLPSIPLLEELLQGLQPFSLGTSSSCVPSQSSNDCFETSMPISSVIRNLLVYEESLQWVALPYAFHFVYNPSWRILLRF